MEFVKGTTIGKYLITQNTFSINGRKHCSVKCLWCGKEFQSQLRNIKKGIGCSCKSPIKIGDVFGELEVLSYNGKFVYCKCKCGSIKRYIKGNLFSGNTTNCGCIKVEKLINRSTKHGMANTKIYKIYLGMKSRCYNPKEYAYKWYGNLGIGICKDWLGEKGFINFYDWAINNGYKEGLSIERKDISKNYCPENCTWIETLKQNENTRNTIRIYNEKGFCFVKDISKKYNVPKSTIYSKIKKASKENLTEEELIKLIK